MNDRSKEVLAAAEEIFRQDPDWATFFRKVVGMDGIVRKTFTSASELANFEQTSEYAEIQRMQAKLRERTSAAPAPQLEPTRVITVRLPKSLHESLRAEAHEMRTSMNKLCISKLLQIVDEILVPSDSIVEEGALDEPATNSAIGFAEA